MLKIRLQRTGRAHEPSYRLVLTDSKNSTKSGRALEVLGSHDFRKETTQIDGEKVKYWMKNGAQVSDTVHNLLLSHKIIEGKKKNVLPKKTVPKKDLPAQAGEPETPKAEAPIPAPEPASAAESPATEAPKEPEVSKEEPKEETKIDEASAN